jgi:hypothetical protein
MNPSPIHQTVVIRPLDNQSPPPPTQSPITNVSSPACPTTLLDNKMIVSPQSQLVLAGEKDTELMGILPITNAASPAYPVYCRTMR